ncbi:thioesterase family protein [Pseudofrankia sp. BMG5.37]|nr:thioesterase family protein [Pseudofrankia sp. BMG5.37]
MDHAVWFHRPARLDDRVLMVDVTPHAAANGRGVRTGTIHSHDGRLLASLTRACLFRDLRPDAAAWRAARARTGLRHHRTHVGSGRLSGDRFGRRLGRGEKAQVGAGDPAEPERADVRQVAHPGSPWWAVALARQLSRVAEHVAGGQAEQ